MKPGGVPFQDGPEGVRVGQVAVFSFEADCDGDGINLFGGDCDDTDGNASGDPGEVESLLFTDKQTVGWMPPSDPGGTVAGLSYDVIRSSDATDFATGAVCDESDDGTDTAALLTATPAVGDVYYFLVRAQNACGVGPAGFDGSAVERAARDCP